MNGIGNQNKFRQRKESSPSSAKFDLNLSGIVDALAERRYQLGFLEVVTLHDCIRYCREQAGKFQGVNIAGFVLSVRKNLDPRNENDNYIVVQGLLNEQNKSITVNGESLSRVMHARTIDDDLIKALNGKETMILQCD